MLIIPKNIANELLRYVVSVLCYLTVSFVVRLDYGFRQTLLHCVKAAKLHPGRERDVIAFNYLERTKILSLNSLYTPSVVSFILDL